MSGRRLRIIIAKEWLVLSRDVNSILLLTIVPLLVIAESVVIIWLVQRFAGDAIAQSAFFQGPLEKLRDAVPAVADLDTVDQIRVFLLAQLNLFLLLIPTMVAVSLSTFSIVDEKLSGSLEALLATPIRTGELLLGKALAGAIPALVAAWVSSGLTLLVVSLMGWGNLVAMVVTPAWVLSLVLMVPAVGLLAFLLGVIGSSRARDPKNAQNLVVVIILPVFGLIALQVTGVLWLGLAGTLALACGLLVVDMVVLRLAVALFQRESIVLRWR